MIRHELTTSIVRFYNSKSDDPFHPHDAICTLVWEESNVVWVKGLNGSMSRSVMREFVQFLHDQGVDTIKAHRDPGRTIPFISSKNGDHVEVKIADIIAYMAKRPT